MSRRGRPWLGVVLLVASLLGGCSEPGSEVDPASRSVAPAFELRQLDGSPVRLADHRGKTVIVDFWATWCAPCEVQMPVLDTLWSERGGEDLMIVGVSVDTDPVETVAEWVEERSLDYPIVMGDQELAMRYGAIGFPTLVVIDPQGGIHTRHTGVLSRPELDDILESIRREVVAGS